MEIQEVDADHIFDWSSVHIRNRQGSAIAFESGSTDYRYIPRNPPIKHAGVMGDSQVLEKFAVLQCRQEWSICVLVELLLIVV